MLRPYQTELTNNIWSSWNNGNRFVLAVLPTGGGKSVVVSNIVSNHKVPSVVIAHRQELVSQMSVHLANEGLLHRIIAPRPIIAATVKEHREIYGKSFYSPSASVSVAGVDTLVSRADDLRDWASQIGFWTIDEAHHVLRANKWGTAVTLFPNAIGLGVTATPKRADGRGLGMHSDGVFNDLIVGPSMRDLISMGYLTDYEIVLPKSDFDTSKLIIGSSGDYTPKGLREAAKTSHIVGDVVQEYIKWAFGKQGITFATDVETAEEMAKAFRDYGIPAAAISANTEAGERAKLIKAFKNRELWQLVNVDLFGEGFDVPAVEVVSMARPTKSLGLYLQQFGRALRILQGKIRALIIDHVSNVKEHGLPDRQRFWSLDGRERQKREKDPNEIPVTACTKCHKVYERIHQRCPYCGHMEEPQGGRRTLESVDGDLTLLDADTLDRMRRAAVLEAPGALAQRVGLAGGPLAAKGAINRQLERLEAQKELADAIALWAGKGATVGRLHPELYRRFYYLTGVDVLTALSLPRSEMERIKEIINDV